MTNMQAALAKAQLERVDELLAKRREIEQYYDERLKNLANVRRMPKRDVVWFYDLLVENRAALQQHLAEKGIETRQFFKPMSQQPMYYNENWKQLKAAQFGHAGIYLPTYVDLTRDDQEYIVKQIESFYRQNPRP